MAWMEEVRRLTGTTSQRTHKQVLVVERTYPVVLVALRLNWCDIMVHFLVILVLVLCPWNSLQRLNEGLGSRMHLI